MKRLILCRVNPLATEVQKWAGAALAPDFGGGDSLLPEKRSSSKIGGPRMPRPWPWHCSSVCHDHGVARALTPPPSGSDSTFKHFTIACQEREI